MLSNHCATPALLLAYLLCGSASAIEVASTRCEGLATPYGLEVKHPRLSWKLRSDKPGDRPTAHQVLVATTPEKLAAGEGDAWDSGRVASHVDTGTTYQGRALLDQERLYWSVRVWDIDGQPSDWSEPASWMTGVLDPYGWEAEWIGKTVPEKTTLLEDAHWIWFPEGDPTAAAPITSRYFRRAFEVRDAEVRHAVLRCTGDDKIDIYHNGRRYGSRSGPNSTKEADITHLLKPGRNVLALRGVNRGAEPNPAGVVSWMSIEYSDGQRDVVISDSSWLTAEEEHPGWEQIDFDDSGWESAMDLGEVGRQPWGDVRHAEDRRLPARNLRREFTLDKPVERAIVSWCGLGASELYANGDRVGDQVLSPAMTQYPERAYYTTRDVTALVHEGDNTLGVVLGNGRFYAPRSSVYAGMPTYGSPMLLLRLKVEHPDGSVTTLVSDSDWRLTDQGPIVANNEYDGEEYDARRELDGWLAAGYDDSSWAAAEVLESPTGRLEAEPIAPMAVTEKLKPISVTKQSPGEYVLDMGQNMVGWCRLKVRGPAGTTVRLRHAERLQDDGSLYLANLRGAKATDYYTLRGEGLETWAPRFTLHGFRYVELTGFPGAPTLDSLEGCVVHDDLTPVGEFECSNEVINQVYRNVRWGFRGNYRTTPLDCPQRDERQGWLGDRLETARSESYVFDVSAFYQKWLRDMRDSQRDDGTLPDIAPIHWPNFSDNVVWPSVSVLLPGILYEQYGVTDPIEDQYGCNSRWVDHMLNHQRDDGLIDRDSYGDWCVPPESPELIHSNDSARITDKTFLASSFFYYDLKLMQRYAEMLGRSADAERFGGLAEELRSDINDRYFDADAAQYSNGTQTSSVLPLAFGLPPLSSRDALAATLVRHVDRRDDRAIATGLVGAQFLCRTLTDVGRPDLAYAIASRTEYPSWGYMVEQDATTIWELWNGDTADPAMNSGNHVMLIGDLVTWLYEDLAGIAADPEFPGFSRVQMRPQPVKGLDWARASFDSPRGLISSHWRRDGDTFRWSVEIPPGVTARVRIPTNPGDQVSINGRPAAGDARASDATKAVEAVHHLDSGKHEIVASPATAGMR